MIASDPMWDTDYSFIQSKLEKVGQRVGEN